MDTIPNATQLRAIADSQPYPLVFATISGAHLYGFPSPDSDFDLRGVHVLPARDVVGLNEPQETIEVSEIRDGLELDLVTHDILKFSRLLLRNNGYVLEQVLSPLVIHTTPAHEELIAIARDCFTKHHAHHYLGFARNQWKLYQKESPPRVKPLLYLYRVLLTGIHLMRTGELQANLVCLNEVYRLPYLPDLIAIKTEGHEKQTLDESDFAFHEDEFQRLDQLLNEAYESSLLPEKPEGREALNDWLIRLRLGG